MHPIFCLVTLCFSLWSFASDVPLQNFLFIGGQNPELIESRINEKVDGVQIIYSWKALEPEKGVYNFERIERDLTFLTTKKKRLWLQLQDRFFDARDKGIPAYLQKEELYQGGLSKQSDHPGESQKMGRGWVTKQWNPAVRKRYQILIGELAKKFDGKIYGINLPETSADIDINSESKSGFSCDKYFEATLENIRFARSVFKKSYVVQFVNFWPCEWENDHQYMSRFFQNALDLGIGLGGPDVVPYRRGQMKNSYPFFNKYKQKLPIVAFAVQEPTRTYINPHTHKKFKEEEFLDFAKNFLGANLIFWSLH